MILFFNVFVTDQRSSQGGMNRVDRLDLFKYSLASYACIDRITEVIVYCQLDGGYKTREEELLTYIYSLFNVDIIPVTFRSYSPANQHEWQETLTQTGLHLVDEPILYMGNDDHVFIDYDLDVLYEGLNLMAKEPVDQINTIHISSWVEAISTVYGLNDFRLNGRYWEAELLYSDACQIVNSTFFKHVFFDLKMGDVFMRRTDPFLTNWYPTLGDYAFPSDVPHPKVKTFVPLRELVRHFDAYWHVRVPFDCCPLLEIPAGFFEGNIKTYSGLLQDVPLFWRSRMPGANNFDSLGKLGDMILARNEAHKKEMTAPHERAHQRPTLCVPAEPKNNYRSFGNDTILPLEEKYIEVGYR